MADDDKMLDEMTRRFATPEDDSPDHSPGAPIHEYQDAEELLSAVSPDLDDERPPLPMPQEDLYLAQSDPQFTAYKEALANARAAIALYERTRETCRSRKRALARLPFPWVRPSLRFLLWCAGGATAFLASNPVPRHWQGESWSIILFTALALLCGEGFGQALNRILRSNAFSARLMHLVNALLYALLLAILFGALYSLQKETVPSWFAIALAGLAAAASLTLPWFGSSQKEYERLLKSAEKACQKHDDAGRRAKRASDRLARIHRANLQQIPPKFRNRKRRGLWGKP